MSNDMPLESCPFCGEAGDKIELISEGFDAVVCRNCGARGPMYDEHPTDAVAGWNHLDGSVLRRLYHQMLQMESLVERSGAFPQVEEGSNARAMELVERSTGLGHSPEE